MAAESCFDLYSVGGKDSDRQHRKLLVDLCDESLEPHSFVLPDGDESFRLPAIIPKLRDFPSPGNAKTRLPEVSEDDIVLLIGKIQPKQFDELVLGKKVDIWLQGPGFNYGTLEGPELDELKKAHGAERVNNFPAPDCPVFNLREWYDVIFPLYPAPLQELKAFQIGSFWLTPVAALIRDDSRGVTNGGEQNPAVPTDAFLRQFQMHSLVEKNQLLDFHKEVLEEVVKQCKIDCIEGAEVETLGVLKQALEGITCAGGKQQLEEICKVYSTVTIKSDAILGAFTRVLMLKMPAWSSGIREYDAYVAHQMLRKLAGLPLLDCKTEKDRALHLDFVVQCLRRRANGYIIELRRKISAQKRTRRLHVLHDLGLDPQNDDWLAIQVLGFVYNLNPKP
jgi:hypothetical protein